MSNFRSPSPSSSDINLVGSMYFIIVHYVNVCIGIYEHIGDTDGSNTKYSVEYFSLQRAE